MRSRARWEDIHTPPDGVRADWALQWAHHVSIQSGLYEILNLRTGATIDEVKAAFRTLALRHHPDRNGNSPESTAKFRLIHNAYIVLSDPERRRSYDRYRETSSTFATARAPAGTTRSSRPDTGAAIEGADTVETLLNHLNFILWDVQDLVDGGHADAVVGNTIVSDVVLKVLRFIDVWVLGPAGFPDYFYQSREMETPPGGRFVARSENRAGHQPFVNLQDYFFNVRRRTDRLLSGARLVDLLQTVSGTGIRVIDCVLEAHDLGCHYLGHLGRALSGEIDTIPDFQHSDPCFDE